MLLMTIEINMYIIENNMQPVDLIRREVEKSTPGMITPSKDSVLKTY